MENFTEYQYAWMIYLAGAIGCCLATWLLFRRAGRAWVHFFVITVMVLLLTPYAIDADDMIMAPAIFSLVFGFMDGGFTAVKAIVKLMLGIWVCALVLSLIFQLLTRHRAVGNQPAYTPPESPYPSHHRPLSRHLSREEHSARDELLHEEPIRAIR